MGRISHVGVRRFLVAGVAVFVLVAASAALAAASGWSIQRTPNPPAQEGSGLDGVSCSSGSACTAVGSSVTNDAHLFLTLAERWNGMRWSIQHTPNPTGALETNLPGVSCSSGNACTAVGNYLTHNETKTLTLAERWNGTRWSIQPTPNPTRAQGADNELHGVWCSSGNACIAVGSYLNGSKTVTLAERWNGTRWSIQHTPNPTGPLGPSVLNAISCSSANACTAVGNNENGTPLAERWNGTRWSIQPTPKPTDPQGNQSVLTAVSCPSANACTAVGNSLNASATTSTPLAERWNGTRWSIQRIPSPTGAQSSELHGVSCSSASACTAVGLFVTHNGTKSLTLAERWNGTRWSIQHTPNPLSSLSSELHGVSCWSRSACTAVGVYLKSKELSLAERWNGP